MQDGFGRNIDYLRVSLTDKCNLRCRYCMPRDGVQRLSHDEILSLEEWLRVIKIMQELGIRKVRFTGGEPLVRKIIIKLIEDVHELGGIEQIAMTTNGILLGEMAAQLRCAGLTNVNVSLDTLNPETFKDITGVDALDKVLSGIEEALNTGMKVKINCVPCREWNIDDICDVAELAKTHSLDVRFIELMPVGCGKEYHGIKSDEVLGILEGKFGSAHICDDIAMPERKIKAVAGPAQYYEFEGFCGRIGFISAMSHKFCSECNRVRMTAEGRLKLCLNYNDGVELRPLLRDGSSDMQIKAAIMAAVMRKPGAHDFNDMSPEKEKEIRKMVQIGG